MARGPNQEDQPLSLRVVRVEARARALVADTADAGDLRRTAVERLGRTRLPTEIGRAHLGYGEWLRRENRRVDAREQLRAAYHHFTSIGMEVFAERAQMELLLGATQRPVAERAFSDSTGPPAWKHLPSWAVVATGDKGGRRRRHPR
jgi:hypothetical protein